MEQTTNNNTNVVLQKKMGEYGSKLNDFVAPQELTVTITLSEYRDLVAAQAVSTNKVSEANSARWGVEKERDALRKENAELKGRLYELTKPCEAGKDVGRE